MASSKTRVLVLLVVALFGALHHAYARDDSSEPEGVVKTIEDKEYSVLIDCIDIYKQPALKHPLIRNHTIQMEPSSSYPTGPKEKKSEGEPFYQSWSKYGECPQGTIPVIRRNQQTQTAKRAFQSRVYRHRGGKEFHSPPGVEVAQLTVGNGSYTGAHGLLNVWQPMVVANETSSSQIQVISQDGPQALGAGWMVDPSSKFGSVPCFFIYWMADEKTGCINLECSGFVQADPKYALGYPIQPISTYDGEQFNIETTIMKDEGTGNWWLQLPGTKWGYWPASLFKSLRISADAIIWGGQVLSQDNAPPGSQHTMTKMGSGHFAEEGFGKSCFMQALWYQRLGKPWHIERGFEEQVTRPECYNLEQGKGKKWGAYFYFGGPGYSDKCQKSGK